MLLYALIAFAIGAAGGLVMALGFVLRGRLAPWALSLLHAALGALGIVLLIYTAIAMSIPQAALIALILFVIAALGGFYLASIHLRSKVAPAAIVLVHAGVAVIGFLVLLGVVVHVI